MKRYRSCICFVFFLMYSVSIYAWGQIGHRIVAQIAQNHLNIAAQRAVAEITGGKSLAAISNWADYIKSDTDPQYKKLAVLHYISLPYNTAYHDVEPNKHGDIITGIQSAINHLKNHDRVNQFEDLALLVHLVADAHQPLHIGNGLDRGGNTCKVFWFSPRIRTTLHQVWDSKMINYFQLSYAEYAGFIDVNQSDVVKKYMQGNITQWVYESQALHNRIYPDSPDGAWHSYCEKSNKDAKLPLLGHKYIYQHKDILDQQLLRAGLRLAKILNTVFS